MELIKKGAMRRQCQMGRVLNIQLASFKIRSCLGNAVSLCRRSVGTAPSWRRKSSGHNRLWPWHLSPPPPHGAFCRRRTPHAALPSGACAASPRALALTSPPKGTHSSSPPRAALRSACFLAKTRKAALHRWSAKQNTMPVMPSPGQTESLVLMDQG